MSDQSFYDEWHKFASGKPDAGVLPDPQATEIVARWSRIRAEIPEAEVYQDHPRFRALGPQVVDEVKAVRAALEKVGLSRRTLAYYFENPTGRVGWDFELDAELRKAEALCGVDNHLSILGVRAAAWWTTKVRFYAGGKRPPATDFFKGLAQSERARFELPSLSWAAEVDCTWPQFEDALRAEPERVDWERASGYQECSACHQVERTREAPDGENSQCVACGAIIPPWQSVLVA